MGPAKYPTFLDIGTVSLNRHLLAEEAESFVEKGHVHRS